MGLLNLEKLIASFREAIGWPYVSPGSNDRNGIDCSGMFVRAYRLQGASIYHGSNTIWRKSLSDRGEIHDADQLRPGMAVFKHRDADTAKYPDGQGDYYHIGLVVSTNPPHIIHASTNGMKVREDRWSKAWTHWGKLRDVDYNGGDAMKTATVATPNGGVLNLRAAKSTTAGRLALIPNGTVVDVLDDSDVQWYWIRYHRPSGGDIDGFVVAAYLDEGGGEVAQGISLARFEALEKRVASIEQLLYKATRAATMGGDDRE